MIGMGSLPACQPARPWAGPAPVGSPTLKVCQSDMAMTVIAVAQDLGPRALTATPRPRPALRASRAVGGVVDSLLHRYTSVWRGAVPGRGFVNPTPLHPLAPREREVERGKGVARARRRLACPRLITATHRHKRPSLPHLGFRLGSPLGPAPPRAPRPARSSQRTAHTLALGRGGPSLSPSGATMRRRPANSDHNATPGGSTRVHDISALSFADCGNTFAHASCGHGTCLSRTPRSHPLRASRKLASPARNRYPIIIL